MASGKTSGSSPRRAFAALQLIPGGPAMPTLHAPQFRVRKNPLFDSRGLENTPAHAMEQDNKLLFLRPSAA